MSPSCLHQRFCSINFIRWPKHYPFVCLRNLSVFFVGIVINCTFTIVTCAPCTVVDQLPVYCFSKHYPVIAVETIYVFPHSAFIRVAFYFCNLAEFQVSYSLEKSPVVFMEANCFGGIILWKTLQKVQNSTVVGSKHLVITDENEIQINNRCVLFVCLFVVIYLFVQVCAESHGISGLLRKGSR